MDACALNVGYLNVKMRIIFGSSLSSQRALDPRYFRTLFYCQDTVTRQFSLNPLLDRCHRRRGWTVKIDSSRTQHLFCFFFFLSEHFPTFLHLHRYLQAKDSWSQAHFLNSKSGDCQNWFVYDIVLVIRSWFDSFLTRRQQSEDLAWFIRDPFPVCHVQESGPYHGQCLIHFSYLNFIRVILFKYYY